MKFTLFSVSYYSHPEVNGWYFDITLFEVGEYALFGYNASEMGSCIRLLFTEFEL